MNRPAICLGAILFALAGSLPADAKPARCFTTDDGHYDCEFRLLERNGSFEISAPGRPTFSLWIDEPGVGTGFADFGGRNVALPGSYVRERRDRACWANADTRNRICAW